jgi:hypothetical protein
MPRRARNCWRMSPRKSPPARSPTPHSRSTSATPRSRSRKPRWPRANARIRRASRSSSSTMPWTTAIPRLPRANRSGANIEQAAHPVIPGRNLVRVALKTAAAGRSAAQPLRLTLLVDQSGSMSRADRRAAMDAAMTGLGKLLTEKDLVNVDRISRTPRLLADGTRATRPGKTSPRSRQPGRQRGRHQSGAGDRSGRAAGARRMLAGAQNRIVLSPTVRPISATPTRRALRKKSANCASTGSHSTSPASRRTD